jgi:hypothetical protein
MDTAYLPLFTVEDALARIIEWLRTKHRKEKQRLWEDEQARSFDIREMLKEIVEEHRRAESAKRPRSGPTVTQLEYKKNSGSFHTAAWELVRRGILRPQARESQHGYPPADFGWFFVTTEYGRRWLAALTGGEAIPMEYGRFSELLAGHAERFGAGYASRSQEAVRCYQAQAYLACCAMCGAAAESVLLAVVIAKTGDETAVLDRYSKAGGRKFVENAVGGQLEPRLRGPLDNYMDLLKYWRDNSAHGKAIEMDEETAFGAMLLLLRLAGFADREWEVLMRRATNQRRA